MAAAGTVIRLPAGCPWRNVVNGGNAAPSGKGDGVTCHTWHVMPHVA